MKNLDKSFENNPNYIKIIRYADDKLKNELTEYIDGINAKVEEIRKNSILAEAKSKMVGENIADYECAIQLLESISGWKDSCEVIVTCNNKIADIKAKVEAEQLEKQRQKEIIKKEKARIAKRNKKIAIITAPIVCAISTFIIILNTVIIPIGNYKKQLQNIKVGSYINFGTYEQDNNNLNRKEDIEWLVLEIKEHKALVISKYALDCKEYNTSYTDITWEASSLREWLNHDFINVAFSAVEKDMIHTETVSADMNPEYSTNPGNVTRDQVFLLSITEVNKYFDSDKARQCEPTPYAIANGTHVNSGNDNCWWWLRSPGSDSDCATGVNNSGTVNVSGAMVGEGYGANSDGNAVRPAMWIDLSKIVE